MDDHHNDHLTIDDRARGVRCVCLVPRRSQPEGAAPMPCRNMRLDPAQLYHVSRHGLDGGLSRVLVALNFPIALVAIALVLVALDALPGRAWWVGGPAIALCAVTGWPGVVDQADLDARVVNV